MAASENSPEHLSESLRLCRLELAQVRTEQEPLLEDLARERERVKSLEGLVDGLAHALNTRLLGVPTGTSNAAKLRRLVTRYRRSRDPEWRQVALLEGSALFSVTWYLQHYPAVLASGLPPALHYLRHGAAEGLDPGPDFNTRQYLRSHPKVAAAGENPLVHHLEHPARGRGSSKR